MFQTIRIRRRGTSLVLVTLILVALAVILLSITLIVRAVQGQPRPTVLPPGVSSTSPTIERLEALQELTIQKVSVSDVMEYRNGWTAAWLVKGDGLISIPLKEARIIEIDRNTRTARIVLPPPRVLMSRVDHQKTLHYDSQQGVWNRFNLISGESYPDVTARAMKEMELLVEHAVAAPENFEQARLNAAVAVKALYKGLDWDVTVDWQTVPQAAVTVPASPGDMPAPSPSPGADPNPKPSG